MKNIRYIGNRKIKRDNVAGTNTLWIRENPVVAVEDDFAAVLLQYSTVWVEDTEAEVAPAAEPTNEVKRPTIKQIEKSIDELTDEQLADIADSDPRAGARELAENALLERAERGQPDAS